MEGIKGYQKAGRSIGRTWQGVKAELRDTFGRKLACCPRARAPASRLSLIVARDNPLAHRGNYDVVPLQEQDHYTERGSG